MIFEKAKETISDLLHSNRGDTVTPIHISRKRNDVERKSKWTHARETAPPVDRHGNRPSARVKRNTVNMHDKKFCQQTKKYPRADVPADDSSWHLVSYLHKQPYYLRSLRSSDPQPTHSLGGFAPPPRG